MMEGDGTRNQQLWRWMISISPLQVTSVSLNDEGEIIVVTTNGGTVVLLKGSDSDVVMTRLQVAPSTLSGTTMTRATCAGGRHAYTRAKKDALMLTIAKPHLSLADEELGGERQTPDALSLLLSKDGTTLKDSVPGNISRAVRELHLQAISFDRDGDFSIIAAVYKSASEIRFVATDREEKILAYDYSIETKRLSNVPTKMDFEFQDWKIDSNVPFLTTLNISSLLGQSTHSVLSCPTSFEYLSTLMVVMKGTMGTPPASFKKELVKAIGELQDLILVLNFLSEHQDAMEVAKTATVHDTESPIAFFCFLMVNGHFDVAKRLCTKGFRRLHRESLILPREPCANVLLLSPGAILRSELDKGDDDADESLLLTPPPWAQSKHTVPSSPVWFEALSTLMLVMKGIDGALPASFKKELVKAMVKVEDRILVLNFLSEHQDAMKVAKTATVHDTESPIAFFCFLMVNGHFDVAKRLCTKGFRRLHRESLILPREPCVNVLLLSPGAILRSELDKDDDDADESLLLTPAPRQPVKVLPFSPNEILRSELDKDDDDAKECLLLGPPARQPVKVLPFSPNEILRSELDEVIDDADECWLLTPPPRLPVALDDKCSRANSPPATFVSHDGRNVGDKRLSVGDRRLVGRKSVLQQWDPNTPCQNSN